MESRVMVPRMHGMRVLTILGLAVWLVGCASVTEDRYEIRGVVSARQLVALPPDAVLVVDLVDLTVREDDPPVLASRRMEQPGRLPVFYELLYPSNLLRSGHRLAVHAKVLSGGRPWLITDKVNHFIAEGRIARADVTLKPVK